MPITLLFNVRELVSRLTKYWPRCIDIQRRFKGDSKVLSQVAVRTLGRFWQPAR